MEFVLLFGKHLVLTQFLEVTSTESLIAEP